MENVPQVCFSPIGQVQNAFDYPAPGGDIKDHPSRLVLDPAYQDGLHGAAPGQVVLVLFHFHRVSGDHPLVQHPRGDPDREARGVFLLRSPHRPNPIGVTEVEITAVEGNVLTVIGLDAVNRTPILDLKVVRFSPDS